MVKQTAKPNYFNSFDIPTFQKKDEDIDADTENLAAMENTAGWKVLSDYINQIVTDLDQMTTNQMQQGASFEDIGRSTVVKEITKDVLRRVINRVNDARDTIERRKSSE